jgi:hypothetical protein
LTGYSGYFYPIFRLKIGQGNPPLGGALINPANPVNLV